MSEMKVPVGISNRHVHLTQEDLEKLFGPGYKLTEKKKLSQPTQFAAEECVTLVGPKRSIEKVRILGPLRPQTQIEISRTDMFTLGFKDIPLRNSGDLAGTPGIKIVAPNGNSIEPKEGCIIAARHLHLTAEEAKNFGLKDKDVISIKAGGPKGVIFSNVLVRSGAMHAMDFHIDMDDANCAGLNNGDMVEIIK
ncbi:MAG: phosphate propanoyltransferase [Candidatus Riflebacteria bacterium]|jgi:putative phosphotransacetylase|nr:phosphate propanoyltransferase [Candidatus Riflebacteria bacterium]MBR4329975.1 phosphate propanoyltransferase [Candidatus Riflebacteria bacterium]MBR4571018.1 phosphate propanoyltransferase [Candidatus Riflebacteria bacterium]